MWMKIKTGGGGNSNGFTLIELIVVMSIMVIINGVIFFDYPSVMANLALKRTAGEIALVARQAQVYSLSAKSGVSGELVNYGVHFDKTVPNNTKIILFADTGNGSGGLPNNKYDTGSGCGVSPTECVQEFEIQTKDKIIGFSCTPASPACSSPVDIVYQRLSPIATITSGVISTYTSVKITIESPRNSTTKDVTIFYTGYIK